ncbi:YdcF family protein [Nodularia spumigena]|uniref:YdcF family protein n=1 Tax=Nodularia spumigena TaxID=70799 RepID=UPI00232FC723|nr:YdcF family protein [Nodularia spumigena]MDB9347613.1 YdcF family protein [Nodularia spumigena CS-588/01]MDB9353807.1 YdcF family protein [Nodularia spumigena CS-588/05]
MKSKLKLIRWVFAIALVLVSIIPMRIAIAFYQAPVPQAMFVLGGGSARMKFAAQFWQSHQNLDIWVSDFPWNLETNRRIFLQYGVSDEKLHLDGRATDTVTNFTTLVEEFADRDLQNIYLITSDYHMRRSRVIATVVLGSQGIVVTPLAVPSSGQEPESLLRVLRDAGRSILWIVTDRTGARFNPKLE